MTLIVFLSNQKVVLQFLHSKHKKQVAAKKFLLALQALLEKENKKLEDIKEIIAGIGETTFSITRQFFTTLNILAFTLDLKIIALRYQGEKRELIKKGLKLLAKSKKGRLIKPFYSHPFYLKIEGRKERIG